MSDPQMPGPPTQSDIIRGTLDLLILKAVSLAPMHGWAIAQRIEQLSRDALHVGQGSLYPALQRLEEKGWIESDWRIEAGRRAKYYELTSAGRRALGAEAEQWRRYVDTIELILGTSS
jgi:PadR family transcriptional regulator PadR